jgi:hypothetical protein
MTSTTKEQTMKRRSVFGAMLLAILAVSAIASASASALALPTLKFLTGETYPVTFSGTTTATAFLETAIGEKITATQTKLTGELTAGVLGPFTADFTGAKLKENSCNTEGDAAGVILIKGEFHLVFDSFEPLHAAILLLVGETAIKCGATTIHVKGELLGLVEPINTETTTFKVKTHCVVGKKGLQEDLTYWNDAGTKKEKTTLEANFGLGFEKACEEVPGEFTLTSNKMLEIVG